MTIIDVRSMTIRYGMQVAIDRLTLRVDEGETLVLLGPPGAGKSTLCRVLSGCDRPTEGEATVAGLDVSRDAAALCRRIGVCFSSEAYASHLTARENLIFALRVHGQRRRAAAEAAGHLLGATDLTEAADLPAGRLLRTDRRRLMIALALAGDPRVVFLDEPTRDLNPHQRRALWEVLARMRGARTLVVACDDPAEAAVLADRIAVLDAGRLCAFGAPGALCEEAGCLRFEDAYAELIRRGGAGT